jgi:hypothetical protein
MSISTDSTFKFEFFKVITKPNAKTKISSVENKNHIGDEYMREDDQFLGIVENGMFKLLHPDNLAGTSARLTGIQMQEATSPESREIDLSEFEGEAIMVQGHYGGDWIYTAELVDEAGPILTVLVQKLFSR